jgi:3-oxoacyl-[acyl-carrier protein] reductase
MRRVLVTGASSGIGLACARAFLAAGDVVVAHCRSGRDVVEQLVSEHGADRVVAHACDLASEAGCVGLVRAAGPLDVLVHSAGIWNDGAIRTLASDTLELMFRVNTFSAYYLSREAARVMRRGSIAFIGSTAGERGEPGHSHAQELAPEIRVNLVSPGWVRTPMAAETFAIPGKLDRIVSAIPLRRVAEAEDVASAVVFLADERQCHLTGVDLPVSGGALLPMPRG